MSATPDLDALTARAERLAGTCTCDTHTLIRDLLTYATTVRQERDEALAVAETLAEQAARLLVLVEGYKALVPPAPKETRQS